MSHAPFSGGPLNAYTVDALPSCPSQQPDLPVPCSTQVSPTNLSTPEAQQQAAGTAAQSLVLQLLLLLSMLYLAILYRANLAMVLSVACTVACAIIAWQRPVKKAYFGHRKSEMEQPQERQPATKQKSQYPQTHNMSGIWIKDKEASDSMEETLTVMKVNRLIRGAIGLLKGTELKHTEESFQIAVLSGILWFKIVEKYPFSGEMQRFKRRDLRKGMHRGTVQKLNDGAVCVTLEWDPPLGGLGTDVFFTPREGLLYVDSTIFLEGRLIKYRTVYNKLKR